MIRSSFSSVFPKSCARPFSTARVARPVRASARQYTTGPTAQGGNKGLWVALGASAALGGAYFYYQKQNTNATATFSTEPVDFQKVYNAVADILEDDDYDDGSFGPVLVRLAWHASGTYDKESNTGGSNGATMRYSLEANDGANAGLNFARDRLEIIKKKFPGISYADLWTLAGICAIQEMGGPTIPWRAGRQDLLADMSPPNGRLPDASQRQDHIRNVFYRMGFNDQEIVALIGAHALGRCHTDRSGFDGPWTFSPTTFTNDFYNLLLDQDWKYRDWSGPAQYQDQQTKSLMMLPADYALIEDKEFKKYVQLYAKDSDKFFSDFAKAFGTLLELGVPKEQLAEPIEFVRTEDQTN